MLQLFSEIKDYTIAMELFEKYRAYDKVERTIISCQNLKHLKTAKKLMKFYEKQFGKSKQLRLIFKIHKNYEKHGKRNFYGPIE